MWDKVVLELVACGNYDMSDWKCCEMKFNKLFMTEKPTMSMDIPVHVKREQMIQEKIFKQEMMGHASLNELKTQDLL